MAPEDSTHEDPKRLKSDEPTCISCFNENSVDNNGKLPPPDLARASCLTMEFLNALSIELCDTVLCCGNWYVDGKPPQTPSPVMGLGVSFDQEHSQYTRSNTLSKHSSMDHGEETPTLTSWELCDIRKPQKPRPTLKQLAEEYLAKQRAEDALRMQLIRVQEQAKKREERDGEEEDSKKLNKDASFVTTDDDSLDLRASSFCSVSSSNMIDQMTKKDSSRDISFDETEDAVYRPGSKLETDSKDSGYCAELQSGWSKRKLVKFPNHHENIKSPDQEPLRFRSGSSPRSFEHDVCFDSLDQRSESGLDTHFKVKKKNGLFSSFRSKKHSEKEDDDKPSSSKKMRKKKSVNKNSIPNTLQVTPNQNFVIQGRSKSPTPSISKNRYM